MKSFAIADGFEKELLCHLGAERELWGPVHGNDGVTRLTAVSSWDDLEPGGLPLIPLKKLLLPPREEICAFPGPGDSFSDPPCRPRALVGIPPCDLYALDYLDRVFAEDPFYQRRRTDMLVLGTACTPSDECFCAPRPALPLFDLFLAEGRVWAGSARGEGVLDGLRGLGAEESDLPLPMETMGGRGGALPENLPELFSKSATLPLWRETGSRCLSCGACSAVCPTCYCYDVVDEALPGGRTARHREWDNCFFRSHALVAGGHNFRPRRGDRLRFRFEHKFLGFGPLRGEVSCVGCGRCARACPVDIDISSVLTELSGEEQR
ncbi:MAG: 4Fe-4S ferredoxin [Desulfuromonas sp.]|uniref:4Fe-4S dicluster domain-containing protein n=1 Tax=Desulfuromonas sp. TaxID=892 RepID=UPI000CB5ED7C|nr:4Fe-4S dicluster domain-containing protein [Desulfuromonas sp.]PLX82533.1 MAG: 4Fe-4S ferredoxin [Desulfuromonas sp.]